MQMHILSRFKIQSLENGPGDFILEDLFCIIQDQSTKIIDREELIPQILRDDNKIRYHYVVSVEQGRQVMHHDPR